MGTNRNGFTLIEILVVVVFLTMVASLVLPAMSRASRFSKLEQCRANLSTLFTAHEIYFNGSDADASLRGRELWYELTTTRPPLIKKRRTLICPLVERPDAPGIQYWGPAKDVTKMEPGDFLACDDVENHGPRGHVGGSILLKSGEVLTKDDMTWRRAVLQGGCSP